MERHVTVSVPVQRSARVLQVGGMFDMEPEKKAEREWLAHLPIEEREWSIGLIVGASGVGKSTLARELFGDHLITSLEWPADAAIIDAFPEGLGIKAVVGHLTSVGLSSPPAWVRPYRTLSTGEQFRATMARALAENEDLVVIDEFTSTVDRQVAKVACHAVQKATRKRGRRLVAVTCHFDVVDWLQPDWVYQPDGDVLTWRSLQRHPPLELSIASVDHSAWPSFEHHHYMSGNLHKSAHCFGGFIDDQCVAFSAYLHLPHFSPKAQNIKMGHRLVVLPDYQGLGIGGRMDDWLGQYLWDQGYRYHNVVAHPAMIAYYQASPRWHCYMKPGRGNGNRIPKPRAIVGPKKNQRLAIGKRQAQPRRLSTYGFEYRPAAVA